MGINKSQIKTLEERVEHFSWMFDEGNALLKTRDDHRKFKGRGMSKSSLDYVTKSMEHYFGPPIKQTDAMVFGNAFHTMILEPDKFHKEYAKIGQFDRRTKIGKEGYAEAVALVGKRTAIQTIDWNVLQKMKESVWSHPLASSLLSEGYPEETVIWNDERTRVLLKGRTDWRNEGEKCIIDLKSCMDASFDEVSKEIFGKLRYFMQAAMYVDGFNSVMGGSYSFKFIFVEKKPPYGVCVYGMDELAIECGMKTYGKDIDKLLSWYFSTLNNRDECYSGYASEEVKLTPPAWLLYNLGIKRKPNAENNNDDSRF